MASMKNTMDLIEEAHPSAAQGMRAFLEGSNSPEFIRDWAEAFVDAVEEDIKVHRAIQKRMLDRAKAEKEAEDQIEREDPAGEIARLKRVLERRNIWCTLVEENNVDLGEQVESLTEANSLLIEDKVALRHEVDRLRRIVDNEEWPLDNLPAQVHILSGQVRDLLKEHTTLLKVIYDASHVIPHGIYATSDGIAWNDTHSAQVEMAIQVHGEGGADDLSD